MFLEFLFVFDWFYYRYQLMLNCWHEYAENRPTFPELVREFDRMISIISDKVSISLTSNSSH